MGWVDFAGLRHPLQPSATQLGLQREGTRRSGFLSMALETVAVAIFLLSYIWFVGSPPMSGVVLVVVEVVLILVRVRTGCVMRG